MTTSIPETFAEIGIPDNPFPGLRPFDFDESHLFFGRDGQSERLIEKLGRTRFLAVVGTSGSGKSSLVRAGLLPALLGGFMSSAGSDWRIAILRPGNDPIGRLAAALNAPDVFGSEDKENQALQIAIIETTLQRGSRGLVDAVRQNAMPDHENLLVVVDQFEELFRFAREASRKTREEGERFQNDAAALIKLLLEAHSQREVNIYVVFTMRSDFLGDCSQFWGLPEAINESQYLIPRLTRDQLREAITAPVAVAGGRMTPRLINRLLNDVGDDQDQLPVLQHLLMRVWNEWKEKRLEIKFHDGGRETTRPHKEVHEGAAIDLCCYEAVGGMNEALSLHADEAYGELSESRRKLTEWIFRSLTEKGPDNREVRRPLIVSELCAITEASENEVLAVIEAFRQPGRSFLMPPVEVKLSGESLIDISHESLIRNWKGASEPKEKTRLCEWVNDEARCARDYRRLAETAVLYQAGKAAFWRDPDLQNALAWRNRVQPNGAWARRYDPNFEAAMAFLDASYARQGQLKKEEERRRLRKITLAYAIAVVLALLLFFAFFQWNKAEKALGAAEAEAERSRRLSYNVNINFAQREFDQHRLGWIPSLLNEFLDPKLKHLRGFEWYYFWRLVHKEKGTLAGHDQEIYSVAVSPDGSMLATASRDLTVKLWDTATHANVATLKGHQNSVTCVAFSPDGKILGTGSWDKTAKLWDVATRQELATIIGHTDAVFSIAFSSDGKTVTTGGRDKVVNIWNLATREKIATLEGHTESVNSVSFSPTRPLIATASWDGQIRVWDAVTHKMTASTLVNGKPYKLAFSPDGKTLAASVSKYVKTWDSVTLQEKKTFEGHTDSVFGLAFSHDGKFLATASGDRTAKLWDVTGAKELATYIGHSKPVISIAFSSDDNTLLTGSEDMTAKLWDRTPQNDLTELKDPGSFSSVDFSPDQTTLAAGTSEGTALFDSRTGNQLATLSGHTGPVLAVAFAPDGKILATVSSDKTIKIWDVAARSELATLTGHQGDLSTKPVFSPDGKLLAVGSGKTIKLWDVATKTELTTFTDHTDEVYSVAFSPDGAMVASGSKDGTVKLFDVENRRLLETLNGNGDMILSVVFSPNGKLLATGSGEKNVVLWDTATRKPLKFFAAHSGPVFSIAFSPDGKTLASGSSDKTIRLWDTTSLQELVTLTGATSPIFSIAFSPDGSTLAAATFDSLKFWLAATQAQVMNQIK